MTVYAASDTNKRGGGTLVNDEIEDGPIHWSFESGKLQGWHVVSGFLISPSIISHTFPVVKLGIMTKVSITFQLKIFLLLSILMVIRE